MQELKVADIDVATYLVASGFTDYEVENVNGMIYFIFKGSNVEEVAKRFPESDVNKILSIYYGLKKITRIPHKK